MKRIGKGLAPLAGQAKPAPAVTPANRHYMDKVQVNYAYDSLGKSCYDRHYVFNKDRLSSLGFSMNLYFSEVYPITKHISKPFRGEWGPGICYEDEFKSQFPSKAFLGELSLCIYEMQELCYQNYRSDEDRGRLRQELIKLFNADKVHWLGMNSDSGLIGDKKQEDPDYNGIQPYAVSVWEEAFFDEIENNSIDSEEEYHIDMLKLMVKRCMWDVLFPGETLPSYTEPTSGDLSLLDYSVMK